MAEQSILMKLMMSDTATPVMQGFANLVEKLQGQVKNLNTSLDGLDSRMKSIGNNSQSAAAGLEKAASALNGFSSTTEKANSDLNAFYAKLEVIVGTLKSFSTAASGAAREVAVIGTEMSGASSGAARFESTLGSLGNTIKAVGVYWAAAKIGQGLEKSVEEATQLESSQTRLKNLNLGPEANKQINDAVLRVRGQVPVFKQEELTKMALDLVNVTGSAEKASEELERFAKVASVIGFGSTKGFKEMDVLNIAKSLEISGKASDPAEMDQMLEQLAKAVTTTQGRVGPSQLLGNLKYSKNGLKNTLDIDFIPELTAMIEMVQSSGGNGGQVGSMLTSLQKVLINGPNKEKRINAQQNGLLNEKGGFIGSDKFQSNPFAFAQEIMKPKLEALGVEMTDPKRVNEIIMSMIGDRGAADILSMMLTNAGQIKKDAALQRNSLGVDAQNENNMQTTAAQWKEAEASINDLEIAIGEKLNPIVRDSIKWVKELADSFTADLKDGTNDAMPLIAGAWEMLKAVVEETVNFMSNIWSGFKDLFLQVALLFMDQSKVTGDASKDWATAVSSSVDFVIAAFRNFMAIMSILVEGFLLGMQVLVTVGGTAFTSIADFTASCVEFMAKALSGDLGGAVSGFSASMSSIRSNAENQFDAMARSAESAAARMKVALDVLGNGGQPAPGSFKFDMKKGGEWDAANHSGGSTSRPSGGKDNFKISPPGGGGGGKGAKDPEASIEAENARFEKEMTQLHLREMDDLYKDHLIGIKDYYSQKAEAIKKGTADEIAAFEKQRDALAKDPKKNAVALVKVDHQIEIAQEKEKLDLMKLVKDEKVAILALDKQGFQIEEQIQSITKTASTAKIAILDEEYAKKRKILEINGQIKQAGELDTLHLMQVNKVRYDDEMTQMSLVKQKEHTLELQAQSDRKKGLINTQEMEQQIIEGKREEGEKELVLLDAAQKYAESIKDPAMLENIKQMKIAAQDLADTLDEGAQKFKETMQSSLEGALNELMSGKFSFKKFIDGIVQSINKSVAKSLSESITNGLFGKGKDGQGGLLSSLLGGGKEGGGGNFLTNLFGGSSNGKKGGFDPNDAVFGNGGDSALPGADIFGSGSGQGESSNPLTAASKQAAEGLKNMTKNGVDAATDSMIKSLTEDEAQNLATQTASEALQQLAEAAQSASESLQSMGSGGSGGGGGGGLGDLFGGGGGGGFGSLMDFLPGFAIGSDGISQDMLAKVHKGEIIIPAADSDRIRKGAVPSGGSPGSYLGGGGGDFHQTVHFSLDGSHDKRSQSQIASALRQAGEEAARRNK